MSTPAVFDPRALPDAALAALAAHRSAFVALAQDTTQRADGSGRDGVLSVRLADGDMVELPPALARVVAAALAEVAGGHAVELRPVEEEMATQAAADLLGVSRPFLVRLLDDGEIPSWKVGTHRRVRRADVLAHRAAMRETAEDALQNLVDQAQDLEMGYGSEPSA